MLALTPASTWKSQTSLYARVLGAQWLQLDEPLRRLHAATSAAHGSFRVQARRGLLARLAAALFGFPHQGDAVPTRLEVARETPERPCEIWRRTFGGRDLLSEQWATADGLLAERFGRIEISLRLSVEEHALVFASTGARLRIGPLRLPLPRWLAPRVAARAAAVRDGIHLRVCLAAPVAGALLEYEGDLEVER